MGGREGRQEGGWQQGGKEKGAHVQREAQSAQVLSGQRFPQGSDTGNKHSAGRMPVPPAALPEKQPLLYPENFAGVSSHHQFPNTEPERHRRPQRYPRLPGERRSPARDKPCPGRAGSGRSCSGSAAPLGEGGQDRGGGSSLLALSELSPSSL